MTVALEGDLYIAESFELSQPSMISLATSYDFSGIFMSEVLLGSGAERNGFCRNFVHVELIHLSGCSGPQGLTEGCAYSNAEVAEAVF